MANNQRLTYSVRPIPDHGRGKGCQLELTSTDPDLSFTETAKVGPPEAPLLRGAIYDATDDGAFDLWMSFSNELYRLLEALQEAEGLDVLTRLSPIRDAAERHVKRYSGMQQPNAEAYQRAVLLCAACDWLECFFLETGKVPTVKELKEDSTGGRLNDRHHLETLEAVLKVLRDDKEKKHRSFKRDVCGGAGKQLWERGGAIEKPEDVPDTDKAGADAVLSRLKEAKARVIQVLPHATTAFPKGFGMGPWRERREELESVAQKWRDFIEDNAVHGTGAKEKVVENLAQKGYTLEQISKMTDAEYAEHRAEILSTLSE